MNRDIPSIWWNDSDFLEFDASWIWSGIHYHDESVVNSFNARIWAELLVRHTNSSVEELLHQLRKHKKTLQLFRWGLLEAFARITHWESWVLSVNAYIWDIWNQVFREVVYEVMSRFKKKYRHQITIEVVETPYGDINGKFIDNIIWLRNHWFGVAIDDYNLFDDEHNNVSREILKAIWIYCTKIKLDWRVVKKLIKQKHIRRNVLDLRSSYSDVKIVAEWIRNRANMLALIGIVDQFQISSRGDMNTR